MSQELVGFGQIMKFLTADVRLVVQFLQRKQSSTRAQPRLPAAIHPLQALHQELDVAYPSTIHLHVNTRAGRFPRSAATVLAHSFSCLESSLDGRKVESLSRRER